MGLVGVIAGLGFHFAHGCHRQDPPQEPGRAASLAATPAPRLVGLGYLPADASLVFVVQPGPIIELAARRQQEPLELLAKAGMPRQFLDALAGTELPLEQIDHVAGAVNVDGLRLSLALVARSPVDEERLLKHLLAVRSNGAKERYSIDVRGIPLSLARVSETVWVFGFDAKQDLAAVDRGGFGPGGTQFSPGLSEMINRVPPDAAVWIATDEDRWAEKALVKMLIAEIMKQPQWLPALARGRSLVASLSLGEPPRLRLFVKAADDGTGDRIRTYFRTRAANAEDATSGGAGELAFFDSPIDPAAAFATLREMLNEAAKP